MNRRVLIPGLLLTVLAGCADLPTDDARAATAEMLAARGHPMPVDEGAAARLLAELSAAPLTVDGAIRIALVNNPRIKAEYATLGFAAADVYDAGRLGNPVLSAWVLVPDAGGEANQVGFGLAQSFTDVLLLRSRSRFAAGEFERAKQAIGANVLNVAADTEIAFVRLAGAQQRLAMRESIARSATVAAELAAEFFAAGNISALELALHRAEASEAELAILQAQADAAVARSALNLQMGLAATEDRWTIRAELPAPVAAEDAALALLQRADSHRLDLAAARQRVTLQADALGVTRSFRWLGEFQVGVETERETDRSRITGPTLAVELPVFNQGRGRIARAEAQLQQAEAQLHALEIDIGNAVQGGVAEVAAARARVAHYRDSLIPLRREIVARTQHEVNYMIDSPFQLLLAKRLEYETYDSYLEALLDYWLARAQLARTVGAALPSSAGIGDGAIDAHRLAQPDTGAAHAHGAQHGTRGTPDTPDAKQPANSAHHHHSGESP